MQPADARLREPAKRHRIAIVIPAGPIAAISDSGSDPIRRRLYQAFFEELRRLDGRCRRDVPARRERSPAPTGTRRSENASARLRRRPLSLRDNPVPRLPSSLMASLRLLRPVRNCEVSQLTTIPANELCEPPGPGVASAILPFPA